jgi:hypothetical protein
MATVRVRIVILTVWITLSVCPFNRMAHTANSRSLWEKRVLDCFFRLPFNGSFTEKEKVEK